METNAPACPACGAPPASSEPVAVETTSDARMRRAVFVVWECGHRGVVVPPEVTGEAAAAAAPAGSFAPPQRECGAGDQDQPYAFRAPSLESPAPFTTRQYARLLALRSRIQEGTFADDGCPARVP